MSGNAHDRRQARRQCWREMQALTKKHFDTKNLSLKELLGEDYLEHEHGIGTKIIRVNGRKSEAAT